MKIMQEKTNNFIDTHLRPFLLSIFLIVILFFFLLLIITASFSYLLGEDFSPSSHFCVIVQLLTGVRLCNLTAHQACPPPSPRVCSNSCLLSQLCYRTISFSVAPFSSSSQSFPAAGSFPMSWPFT